MLFSAITRYRPSGEAIIVPEAGVLGLIIEGIPLKLTPVALTK